MRGRTYCFNEHSLFSTTRTLTSADVCDAKRTNPTAIASKTVKIHKAGNYFRKHFRCNISRYEGTNHFR